MKFSRRRGTLYSVYSVALLMLPHASSFAQSAAATQSPQSSAESTLPSVQSVPKSDLKPSTVVPVPTTSAPEGSSTQAVVKSQQKDPYQYEPVNPEFWQVISYNMGLENYVKVIVTAGQYIQEVKGQNDDESEGKLALAQGLEKLNFSYAAVQVYTDLARARVGTLVGLEALRGLNRITQLHPYDRIAIGNDLLSGSEFGPMPPDVQGFISFHTGLFNLTHGFKAWSDRDFARIPPNTYWSFELEYLKALGDIARNKIEEGTRKLESIKAGAIGFAALERRVSIQLARLTFEKGEYVKAYDMYHGLKDLPARDYAQILVERAWSKFYERDYSKALGELEILETPVYRNLIPLEAYVLKMLIFKELCHYEYAFHVASQFRDRYRGALEDIRKRRELKDSPQLARLALLHQRRQVWADMVVELRDEMTRLQDYNFLDIPGIPELMEGYKNKDAEIKFRMDGELETAATQVAEQLLDTEEQVSFLDYASKLDSLRIISKNEDRRYESERITYTKFDKNYWPVDGEFWSDELEDYKVLVDSQCSKYESAYSSEKSPGEFK